MGKWRYVPIRLALLVWLAGALVFAGFMLHAAWDHGAGYSLWRLALAPFWPALLAIYVIAMLIVAFR